MYNETYDDYIRSILGYPPMNSLNYSYQNYNDYNNQNIYNTTNDSDIEKCYPEIYKIVYPMITKKCIDINGMPSSEDIENMTDEIYYALEEKDEMKSNINLSNDVRSTKSAISTTKISEKKSEVKTLQTVEQKRETRQINRGLRDLIKILLIREILNRPGRPPVRPRPPIPGPGPRPPMRTPFGPGGPQFNRQFKTSNYDIFEY